MTAPQLAILISVFGLLVPVLIFLLTRSFANEKRMGENEGETRTLKARFDMYISFAEKGALNVLHHPDTPALDELIEKRQEELDLPVDRIIESLPDEERVLATKFHEIAENDNMRAGERMAANLALAAIADRNLRLDGPEPSRRPWWRLW